MHSFGWCHIVRVWPWDVARGVQWDLGQGIEQATSWEWCCCQKTTVLPFLRCVLGHCPVGSITYPQPSPNFQCSPPLPPPKSHNITLHPSSPAPLSASPPHSSSYIPKLSSYSPLYAKQFVWWSCLILVPLVASKHTPSHLTQSYWFLSHQSTTPSSPPQSNFNGIEQILDVANNETPWA